MSEDKKTEHEKSVEKHRKEQDAMPPHAEVMHKNTKGYGGKTNKGDGTEGYGGQGAAM